MMPWVRFEDSAKTVLQRSEVLATTGRKFEDQEKPPVGTELVPVLNCNHPELPTVLSIGMSTSGEFKIRLHCANTDNMGVFPIRLRGSLSEGSVVLTSLLQLMAYSEAAATDFIRSQTAAAIRFRDLCLYPTIPVSAGRKALIEESNLIHSNQVHKMLTGVQFWNLVTPDEDADGPD